MHAVTALSLLALAGSALAAPYGGGGGGRGQPHVVYTTEVHTVVVTANGPPPEQTYAPKTKAERPTKKPATTIVSTTAEPPKSTQPVKTPKPEKSTAPAPKPEKPSSAPEPEKPTPSSEAPPPPAETGSGDSGYMATVNEWRQKLGLKDLIHDDKLEANAANTCEEGKGEMVHKLNPGTMGQTLAPGSMEDFKHVFVGGWLCELPDLPGLDGVCGELSKGWTYQGQTGHAEILTSPGYSKIGCACVQGIVGCDFA